MLMDKGLTASKWLMLLMMCFCLNAYGQIYKVVDKNGNVTYTDQAPGDGSEPMDLPDLSVVTTDYPPEQTVPDLAAEAEEEDETGPKALRKLYSDFRISRPAPEETFWGTENSVVLAWEASAPLQEGLMVRFNIDGSPKTASAENMLGVTLNRGTHTVSASIVDGRGRPLLTTDTVTFYVHQNSIRGNGP
jgi:hypothetical protein